MKSELEEENIEADKKAILEKNIAEQKEKFIYEFRKENKKKIKEFLDLLGK